MTYRRRSVLVAEADAAQGVGLLYSDLSSQNMRNGGFYARMANARGQGPVIRSRQVR
jgi:hypothetical protein